MIDRDPSSQSPEFSVRKILETASDCELFARNRDCDYADEIVDGTRTLMDGRTDMDGQLSATVNFHARRSRSEINGMYVGEIEKTTYLIETMIRYVVEFRDLPMVIQRSALKQFGVEAVYDADTTIYIEYDQDYMINDVGELEFDWNINFFVDGVGVYVDHNDDEPEDEAHAAGLLDDQGIKKTTQLSEFVEMFSSEDQIYFAELSDGIESGVGEETDGASHQGSIMALFEENIDSIRYASTEQHLSNIRNLLTQLQDTSAVHQAG